MTVDKTLLDRSAFDQLTKAEECFDLAKAQHEAADAQHDIAAQQLDNAAIQQASANRQREIGIKQQESAERLHADAEKLDALGHALNDGALEIKGEAELAIGRNSPPFRPEDVH
jgi:hypothetical protein